MSINVVVSSTAAGVSVSGGTAVAITVGGGIGPAGFIVAPGTATNSFGTFQLTSGDGITISTSAAQFQIASYGTAAVSSLAPVQSVAGRTGAVSLAAADVSGLASVATSGSYTSLQNIPATFAASSHTHDAAQIASGVLDVARIPTIGYTALSGVPATFDMQAHTHSTADVVGLTASFSQVGHTHSTAAVASFTSAAAAAAPVQSVAGRTGAVTLTASDVGLGNVPNTDATKRANHTGTQAISTVDGLQAALDGKQASGSYAASSHLHAIADVTGLQASLDARLTSAVTSLNSLSGAVTLEQGDGVSISASGSKLTISATGGGGGGNYTLPTASASVLGGIKIGSGLTIDGNGVVTASGGGSSSSVVSAATVAGFPATGSAGSTIYVATDTRRIYGWDATNSVYVELGPGA